MTEVKHADARTMIARSLLRIEDLTIAFRAGHEWSPVVHGVSFDVAPCETVALVGESGSGKSVTAMSLLRLLPANQARVTGRVLFKDRDLTRCRDDEMRAVRGRDIAMIFQEPMTSLNPVMTCGSQITESLIIHRGLSRNEARRETLRLFDRVRISDAARRFDEYPHSLSGGMRQRIMIAIALACKPSLLIADEPTTALDVTIQAQILALIKELQEEEGMAVLFITHDMGVVAEISDRTIVMNKGLVVEAGPTTAIFSSPRQGYTKALLSAVPKLGSMKDRALPERFPIYDRETGDVREAVAMPDTVARRKQPLLEVSGLTTRFELRKGFLGLVSGRVHAVENVSFSVRAGETLSLVGESGCGKSTTGRSVLRLSDPDAGRVILDGIDITALDRRELRFQRKSMQMIFQDPFSSLNPRRRVGDSIVEPMVVNGIADRAAALARAGELMRQVGLDPDWIDRYPHEFSGGQRQRICIARALSVEPKLIVADESVSALDVSVKAQIINLMLDLQEKIGIGYLFISHDMAVVERVSHRVAVMYLGEIVEIGSRQAVFSNPQHPYTRRLLRAVPVADPSRRHLRQRVDNREIRSPIRAPDYVPPERKFVQVGADHAYMEWDDSWT